MWRWGKFLKKNKLGTTFIRYERVCIMKSKWHWWSRFVCHTVIVVNFIKWFQTQVENVRGFTLSQITFTKMKSESIWVQHRHLFPHTSDLEPQMAEPVPNGKKIAPEDCQEPESWPNVSSFIGKLLRSEVWETISVVI